MVLRKRGGARILGEWGGGVALSGIRETFRNRQMRYTENKNITSIPYNMITVIVLNFYLHYSFINFGLKLWYFKKSRNIKKKGNM